MAEPSSSGVRGLIARIANSAEYSIAAALLLVCLVVGITLWLLRPQQEEPTAALTPEVSAPVAAASDEDAALNDWKRRLGEEFSAMDAEQRKRASEDNARRERQRAEEAAIAEARRQNELAAQARLQAEAKAREPVATKPAPPPTAPAPVVRRPPVIVDAAIDWSSCRRPLYPSGSVRRGEEGVVVIAVDLDVNAQIRQSRVSQSSGHESLDRATLDAVRKCRFSGALEDGQPKASTAEVRFTWKLQN